MNERIPIVFARIELRDGELYWKRSGKLIRGYPDREGYLRLILKHDGRAYNFALHRLVWLLHKGAWPTQTIDHINHDRTDNRIENLRDVSRAENHANRRVRLIPRSGCGVTFDRKCSRRPWRAAIRCRGILYGLGSFQTREAALAARLAKEAELLKSLSHPVPAKGAMRGRKSSRPTSSTQEE